MRAVSKTPRVKTYIGLGSNVGDRVQYLRRALERIRRIENFAVIRISPFYETDPVGVADQGPFLNGVVEGESGLSPEFLLAMLQAIERELGRVKRERWGPREIDLDLLFYGDLVVEEPGLILPHPRLHERTFVLVPLANLCETFWHPKLKKTVKELLAEHFSSHARYPKPYPVEVAGETV